MISLIIPLGILILASLVTLSSIAVHFFQLQLVWAICGATVFAIFWIFDWRPFLNYRWVGGGLYAFAVILLLVVIATGPLIRNTRSWITIGQFSLQPVELAKIALILVYARYFSRRHLSIASWRTITISFLYFAGLAGLVMLQPDLGSTLVLFGLWLVFLLVSGLPLRRIALGVLVLSVSAFLLWSYGLEDYQQKRIAAVFSPSEDELGVNYSVTQSKIAIGSAGLWGKGYGQGSEVQLGFLTEPAGDFILAAFIEEWGIVIGIAVILAFMMLLYNILKIGSLAGQNFEKFICLGVAIMMGIQFFLNAGSALGISPVIGVTFPFLSYGGSSLLTNFTLLAIVNSIGVRSSLGVQSRFSF